MDADFGIFMIGVVAGIIMLVAVMSYLDNTPADMYEKGQIDAINGKVCMQLIKRENNTVEWEKIDPCADHTETEQ